jgi:UDP-GlcNAc:undecaprenyl-phosphate GlcNAc-1-phosphate transferase
VNFSRTGVERPQPAGSAAISAVAFSAVQFRLFDLRDVTTSAGVLRRDPARAPRSGSSSTTSTRRRSSWATAGSNLLGLLLGAVIVEGSLKTNALIALVVPLVVLAVPFLDTGFVVAKRIKYRRPSTAATPTTSTTASTASASRSGARSSTCTPGRSRWPGARRAALRPVLDARRLNPGWAPLMAAASWSRWPRAPTSVLRARDPQAAPAARVAAAPPTRTTEHEIDAEVERELETGEFHRARP